ncbi:hypothetical protein KDL45_14215, partial [bacterium]|nr:hypothetical protein [bacterium]
MDRLLDFLLPALIYGTHWVLPITIYVALPRCPRLAAITAGVLVAGLIARRVLSRLPRALALSISLAYYAAVLLLFWVVVAFSAMLNPATLLLVLAISGGYAICRRRGWERGAWGVHLVLAAVVFAVLLRRVPSYYGLIVVPLSAYLIGVALGLWRMDIVRRIPVLAIAVFIATTYLDARILVSYVGEYPGRADAIAAQPGVRLVYGYGADQPHGGECGSNYSFAARMDSRIALFPHHPSTQVCVVSDRESQPTVTADVGTSIGNTLVRSPERPGEGFVGGWDEILQFSVDGPDVVYRREVAMGKVNMMHSDEDGAYLYAAMDNGDRIIRASTKSLDDFVTTEPLAPGRWIYDVAANLAKDRMYASILDSRGVH